MLMGIFEDVSIDSWDGGGGESRSVTTPPVSFGHFFVFQSSRLDFWDRCLMTHGILVGVPVREEFGMDFFFYVVLLLRPICRSLRCALLAVPRCFGYSFCRLINRESLYGYQILAWPLYFRRKAEQIGFLNNVVIIWIDTRRSDSPSFDR